MVHAQQNVDATIFGLRRVLSADTDADLARKLGVDKSTVSGWRSRGSVPKKFTKLLEPLQKAAYPDLGRISGELQERATPVALTRLVLVRAEVALSGDADHALAVLRDMKPFWLVLHSAVQDLLAKVSSLGVDLATAQVILMQDDLRDPAGTIARVNAQLAEDLADNPWLETWTQQKDAP